MPYNESDTDEQIVESKQMVPYEFVESLMEERKRHDEMNAELIRQNGSLIRLLEEKENEVVQTEAAKCCKKHVWIAGIIYVVS